MTWPPDGQLKAMTEVSAAATFDAASHSRLKAARVIAFSKLLAKP
jgi:hypothetical protein